MKYLLYLVVFISYSWAHAGSYDDFFAAVQRDDTVAVTGLINRGFDVNTLSPKGESGLMIAIKASAPAVAMLLARSGATQIDARNSADETPLMVAALKGLTPLCVQLIERGADVNKPGWTPLHYAATGGQVAVIDLLLERYAYIDAESPNGSTPLMMAAMYGSSAAVKRLLQADADPLIKNQLGLTAIDFAHRAERLESVELIAAAVRARNSKGGW